MTEKRYLVYKQWNGKIHSEIRYGDSFTSLEKSLGLTIQEVELLDHTLTLSQAIKMYPCQQEVIRQ